MADFSSMLNSSALPAMLKRSCLFACVALLSYFTYFKDYDKPASLFWDENYHIASAQKYLNHVHYFELHPPLGKLLIAAGELILKPNRLNDQFAVLEGQAQTAALPANKATAVKVRMIFLNGFSHVTFFILLIPPT
jgi:dolichyl-phosphate-mannose--protein O-mannosyl transferase